MQILKLYVISIMIKCPACSWEYLWKTLTERYGVIDFEAAQDLVYVSGVSKTITSHHHLKWLWNTDLHS